VLSCATVEDSVIISATTSAGDGITTAGTISNNYVSGFANGINAAPATVDHNIVNTQASQSSGMSAIFGVSTLTGNVILGPATTLINSTGSSSFAENYCDTSASNCTSCISSGFCSAVPVAPFDFP
jgi:hypothetical protein